MSFRRDRILPRRDIRQTTRSRSTGERNRKHQYAAAPTQTHVVAAGSGYQATLSSQEARRSCGRSDLHRERCTDNGDVVFASKIASERITCPTKGLRCHESSAESRAKTTMAPTGAIVMTQLRDRQQFNPFEPSDDTVTVRTALPWRRFAMALPPVRAATADAIAAFRPPARARVEQPPHPQPATAPPSRATPSL